MELLVVTNKKTQLHKSPSDLSVVCTSEHKQSRAVSSDISFFQSSKAPKCFAQINKPDILEIWRLKTRDGVESFDRVRKTKIDGIQAICCSKNKDTTPEYAIGYSTGLVKIVELGSQNKFKVDFSDPNNKASVISLDYSSCGGYLSTVYENGTINIFGLTTKVKSDSITFDRDSSLARFNPVKRFHLAIASYKGSVTVYDIASKKIHFQQKDAHDAPCRDIAIPEDIPDRMLTCGCDSIIKIFDTRKKATGLQIKSHCGFSTISVTKCGGFFAVGNLKGEVLTYDMRSLRQPLAKMRVDNELVTRVAFMPTWGESNATQFSMMSQRESVDSRAEDLPEPPEAGDDFTMDDIVGFQRGRISEFDLSTTSSRVSAISTRGSDQSRRISENFGKNVAKAFKDLSFSSDASFMDAQEVPEFDDRNSANGATKTTRKDSLTKRRSSYMPSPLQLIREEVSTDKENNAGMLNAGGTPVSISGPRFSSTPATVVSKTKLPPQIVLPENETQEIIDVDALDSFNAEAAASFSKPGSVSTSKAVPSASVLPQVNMDLKSQFEALHEKIHFEVQSLNMDLNMRHIETLTHVATQRRQLESRVKMIEECMGFLLNDDFKISRIMELQDENRELQEQLNDVMRRLNQ